MPKEAIERLVKKFDILSLTMITHHFYHIKKYTIWKEGNDNPICKTEKETQMYRTDFWTLWEKARVGCFERTTSKHVYYLG